MFIPRIGRDQSESVGQNKKIQVGANHTEAIGADKTVTVGASHTETGRRDDGCRTANHVTRRSNNGARRIVQTRGSFRDCPFLAAAPQIRGNLR